MYISQRVRAITPSPTKRNAPHSKPMLRDGMDVVNFSVGEPDFDTPRHIKDAGISAIREGQTKYTPGAGTVDLRKAICHKLKAENGLEYTPEQIVVSTGAKQSLFNTYMAILEPGDEVILQAPYWVSYPEIIKLAGGVSVVINTYDDNGFKMTPRMIEPFLTPRTKAINLNSPSNPTGAVYTREELQALAEFAVAHDLWVVTDEMYERLIYEGAEHVSIASFGPAIKKKTITINGMSKAYAMTGWRMGYCAAELPLAKAMTDIQGHLTGCPNSISQAASVEALLGSQEPVEEMRREFDKRRVYARDRFNAMPGVRCANATGAFYVFPHVASYFGKTIRGRHIGNADDLGLAILEEAKVALVPGTGFGAPDYLRISYATSMERIQTGLDRITALLAEAR